MSAAILVPLAIGAVIVLQGTLNRAMGQAMGLGNAVALNAAIVVALSVALAVAVRARPDWFPGLFSGSLSGVKLGAWMLLPGVFGFVIIAGVPWAISKLGAANVFVALVVAQVVMSLVWDAVVEGRPLSAQRVGGAALAVGGVVLASLDRSS